MLCIICFRRPAILPDVNTTSKRKSVCEECHSVRVVKNLKVARGKATKATKRKP